MGVESGSSDQDEEDQFFARKKVSVSDEDILMRYLKDTFRIHGEHHRSSLSEETVHSAEHSSSSECGSWAFVLLLWPAWLNSRRTRLNDELFEDLVMLRVNKLMCNAIYDVAYSVSNTAETYFLTWFDGLLGQRSRPTFTFYLESTFQRPLLSTFTWVTFFRCTFTFT